MAKLPAAFNPRAQKGIEDFEALPPGWYIVKMIKSEMRKTKNELGEYLYIEWLVLIGEFINRRVFQRLNLINPNETTVEIANRSLTSICDMLGVPGVIDDTTPLHDKPGKIRLIVKPGDSEYPPSNEIRGYKELTAEELTTAVASTASAGSNIGAAPGQGAPASPAAQAMKAAAGDGEQPAVPVSDKPVPPWLRKNK